MPRRLAAVIAIIAVMLTACSAPASPTGTFTTASPTSTSAVATSTSPTATVPVATSPTARPTPTPITELSQVFRPLSPGWRPTAPTLVVARSVATGETTLVALPIESGGRAGASVPIVTLAPGSWALRADGGALVIGVGTGRLAIWDVRSGAARWLTTADAGGGSPIWSKNGSTIYFVGTGDDGNPGIIRIGADGSDRKHLFTHERLGQLEGLTPDGGGLVWTRAQAGGSVDIFDVATGVNRHFENNARVTSWRAGQPRLLLQSGGCCAGRGGGSLVAWDDVAMTSRTVADIGQNADPAWIGGAWDPTGTRIAAGRFDNGISRDEPTLVILDPNTGATQPVPGTLGVGQILWLPEGIVFSLGGRRQASSELMLLHDMSAPAVSLYKDAGFVVGVVRP
jgi:hypothetical protein